jgi:hypothetical protein
MLSRSAKLVLFTLITAAIGSAQTSSGSGNSPVQPSNGQISPAASQNVPNSEPAAGSQINAGTEIHALLDTPLSTRVSKPGDRFTATIADQVSANNGAVVIPNGARVEGEVADAEDSKALAALHDKVQLSLRFRDIVLPNGQTLPLSATLISVRDTSGKSPKKTAEEGQPKAVGVEAGTGTAHGVSFGDPLKGLAIGGLAGGGYVLSTKGKDVNLPAQTGMVIRLDQAVSWNGTSAAIQR